MDMMMSDFLFLIFFLTKTPLSASYFIASECFQLYFNPPCTQHSGTHCGEHKRSWKPRFLVWVHNVIWKTRATRLEHHTLCRWHESSRGCSETDGIHVEGLALGCWVDFGQGGYWMVFQWREKEKQKQVIFLRQLGRWTCLSPGGGQRDKVEWRSWKLGREVKPSYDQRVIKQYTKSPSHILSIVSYSFLKFLYTMNGLRAGARSSSSLCMYMVLMTFVYIYAYIYIHCPCSMCPQHRVCWVNARIVLDSWFVTSGK